ncbi:MAG: hypothetical protein GXX96_36460 [Planctomycetaceae bacterium]|nr:hypothetical protein [Planctomycetaceae bacterium]
MDNTQDEERIAYARSRAERIQADFNLDFSLASLREVDRLLGKVGDCGDDLAGRAAYMFGCYVGEVLVRQAGAVWAVREDMEELFGSSLLLEAGPCTASPFVRCYRRLKDEGDSVEVWGRLVVAAASGRLQTVTDEGNDNDSETEGRQP